MKWNPCELGQSFGVALGHGEQRGVNLDDAEVARLMQERHHPCLPTNGVDDLLIDEQLIARGYFRPLEQPGLEAAQIPSSPIRFDGASISGPGRAPSLGEHNRAVLSAAGFSNDEILWLAQSGVM